MVLPLAKASRQVKPANLVRAARAQQILVRQERVLIVHHIEKRFLVCNT
ncbi:MAG: hypothetical protein ACYSUB_00435 [Planctomycetota bacterium]